MDGKTNRCMDKWNFSPLRRTLSPIRDAAQKGQSMVGQGLFSPPFPPHPLASNLYVSIGPSIVVQRDKISWQTTFFLGSGSERGQSPEEWGEIPSVQPSVHLSVRTCTPG